MTGTYLEVSAKIYLLIYHIVFTAGTIISWVPRPNKQAPENHLFEDDTWIQCNGAITCKSGPFEGQFCSDLSDRVLVGAGNKGMVLEMKDATLPDHAHSHKHSGSYTSKARYRTGPYELDTGKQYMGGSGSLSNKHGHNQWENADVSIDFSKMSNSEAFISKITNPKVTKSSLENDLYSPHMRVIFFFKCL